MRQLRKLVLGSLAAIGLLAFANQSAAADLADDQIRDVLIRESLAGYAGNCPCPEHRDSRGRRCGQRSAYSKPGGYAPLCYRSDVTREMIAKFRRERGS